MRAVQFSQFGGPEVLELVELPEPHPAPGQIRIAVRAVGINPIDWKLRSGAMGGELPMTTGVEAAGVVDETGEGVSDVTVGDEVFGSVVGGGAAAELALLGDYEPIPVSLDFAGAAALPVAVETAARALDLLSVGAGQTVLINGASGAVGQATVQLARERGARVIGTASPGKQELLRELGAQPTTYGDGLLERVRELAPEGVDAALDAGGGGVLPALVGLTGATERVITIVDYPGAQETGVTFSGGPGTERAWYVLKEIGPLIEAGRFSLPVAETFPLQEIAAAHERGEAGQVGGKIVLLR